MPQRTKAEEGGMVGERRRRDFEAGVAERPTGVRYAQLSGERHWPGTTLSQDQPVARQSSDGVDGLLDDEHGYIRHYRIQAPTARPSSAGRAISAPWRTRDHRG
jgi:hypothetical protein